ncbi:DNA-formamidopyrimidine glycosylase ['Fragaria x ananassa' phyllody phytoplasma]|uniref:DNA-formamidopyrimidine glycosylase n=2 Tax='Fragaria x ananassa' phyllody phytoplasma TaxID=2358428 RepID=A0ABS5K2P8_9MOLU|nr:DNA-formamidopyrimidine glycosylase ['Fragaria x ananassa' phyllody phytoplasma]
MPELPEVEIIVRILKNKLQGKKIIATKVFYEPIIKNKNTFKQIEGQIILDIQRKGKFLLFFLTQELVLIGHLRMEGKLFIQPIQTQHDKHEHFALILNDNTSLRYYDFRKFGRFEVYHQNNFLTQTTLHQLALDPFEINIHTFYQRILKTKSVLKKVLLNQKIISGLGNIYVNEILFLAKLHPEFKASSLTLKQTKNILIIAQKVLRKSIKLGGTTISTFEAQQGSQGYFQNYLLVHGKKDQLCSHCDTKIIKIKIGGRGTYLCPLCQKKSLN